MIDPPASGSWNMAVDEALLHSAIRQKQRCLRFYLWDAPTLSLGYFQRSADRNQHAASRDCRMVRRSTGGGAIVHHHELTYSFTTPIKDRASSQATMLYAVFHETLIETLAGWNIRASLCSKSKARLHSSRQFLCFERRSAGDVLIAGRKVAGSAQRRHRNALLQHGSVLLRASRCAPELPGIADESNHQFDPNELVKRWTTRLSTRLGMSTKPDALSEIEVIDAAKFEREKYCSNDWALRR